METLSLNKTLYPLLSTGPTQEVPSRHDEKIVDWGLKYQNKQNLKQLMPLLLQFID